MRTRAISRLFKRSRLVRTSHSFFRKHQDKSYSTTHTTPSSAMNSLQTVFVLIVLAAVALDNAVGSPAPGSLECGRSEVMSRCNANPMCQKTCDNYNKPIACTRSLEANICYPGCICKEGFVRVVQGDQCIPIDKCEGRVKH